MSFSFKPPNVEGNSPESTGEVSSPAAPSQTPVTTNPISIKSPTTAVGGMPLSDRMGKGMHIVQIILFGILGVLVVATVTLFGYQRYLVSSIDSQKKVLDDEDASLASLNLDAMRSLSIRMKVVNQVLGEHASVSTAFAILEKSIENPVTYTRFSLGKSLTGGDYDLQLGAIAPSYKAVAQQLDTLKSDDYSKSFIPKLTYDGLSLDTSGKVSFNLAMSLLIQGKLPELLFTTPTTNSTQAATTADVGVATTTVEGTVVNNTKP